MSNPDPGAVAAAHVARVGEVQALLRGDVTRAFVAADVYAALAGPTAADAVTHLFLLDDAGRHAAMAPYREVLALLVDRGVVRTWIWRSTAYYAWVGNVVAAPARPDDP